jgi:transcription initiation factor TFIID subunit 6
MSFIDPSAIQAIAHSVEVPKLSDEAARTLAPDVEYRLREVIQVIA